MLTNKCADLCPGEYPLFLNISGLENAYALTKAFLSGMVIITSLLRPLKVRLV